MEVLLYFLTGAGIGGLLTYLSTRIGRKGMEVNLRILQEKAKAWEEKEQRWQEEKMAWIRDNERLKENLRQTEEKWRGQKEEILQIAALQKEQFQNLANDILEDKSRRFTEANRENIERILSPLNKDIQEFRKKVEESYSKETVERTVLERKIAELVQLNNRIREDAVNLTNALKGNTKTQGDWGEMILERILENSGLTKGREYFIQETLKDESDRVIRTENGNTMRPDVIVVYPDNRKVIIDSKVSLTAYVDYCNAETETEREVALKAHLLSVRKHIDELSARNYCDWCDGALDFVMLFIQIFINDIQPFFNPFCSVADDFKQSLCYKLWSDHRIEKCITVYRYCKKYVGIFRKKRTWFVRNDYNRGTGVMCHLCSYFILRRITRKTEQYQTICM